jgi:DNA-binding beta-propeller fold protein YncE
MRSHSLIAAGILLVATVGLFAFTRPVQEPKPVNPPAVASGRPAERTLPGLRRDGFVQLPNQWRLKPAGRHLELGDFPVNIALHPTGQYAAVLHAGFREHEVVIVNLDKARTRVVSRASIDQAFYGLTWSPDGRQLYASGGEFEAVHVFEFEQGYLKKGKSLDVSRPEADAVEKQRVVVGGVTLDQAGRELFVASPWGDCVVRVPLDNPDNRVFIRTTAQRAKIAKEGEKGEPPSPPDGRKDPDEKKPSAKKDSPPADLGSFPYVCLIEPGGKRAFVSLWSRSAIGVIDLEKNAIVRLWKCAEHPTEMLLSPKGDTLYVACANSTKVSVLNTETGAELQTIVCALYPQAPTGNTPNSLAMTPDGEMLFVANADANNLAVFNITDRGNAKPLGFIPTGWYPTSVRFNKLDSRLYFTNGKGLTSKSNRSGPNPLAPGSNALGEYIGGIFKGTLGILDLPGPEQMANFTKTAYACSPLQRDNAVRSENVEADNPIQKKLGDPSPIKYCLYIVKENRTYDQIFGDMKEGNGEPELCLFPEPITPNHHKLAREFVLLDNIYVDGEVSADGHEWTMGAYATDFVEKIWPLSYRGSSRKTFGYPSEGAMDQIARPSGGYLWNRCIEAKVSYRTYGEWISNGKKNPDGTFQDSKPTVPELAGMYDPQFRGYDLDYPDVKRAERFISELKRFEQTGDMPRMQVLRLPNDHTYGTLAGKPTPTAMVADNDLALGMVIEALSQSKFWKETAVFVIEDDAQNGPDHVDAHRVTALVISPYTKRRFTDSSLYSTTSMLRTMELILGLKPMSQFDAAARPMYNSFTSKPDFTAYKHEMPKWDRTEVNKPGGFGADWFDKRDFAKEDRIDDLLLTEVVWKSVRGQNSIVPAPTRAAFFIPIGPAKPDDDD